MSTNNKSTQLISLRLPPKVARDFKIEAAQRGMKLNALFEAMLAEYQQHHDSHTDNEQAQGEQA